MNFPQLTEIKVTSRTKPGEDDESEFTWRFRRSRNGEENVLRKYSQQKQDVMATKHAEVMARIEREEVQVLFAFS